MGLSRSDALDTTQVLVLRMFGRYERTHDQRRAVRQSMRNGHPVSIRPEVDVTTGLHVQCDSVGRCEACPNSYEPNAVPPDDHVVSGCPDDGAIDVSALEGPFADDEVDAHALSRHAHVLNRKEIDSDVRDERELRLEQLQSGQRSPLAACDSGRERSQLESGREAILELRPRELAAGAAENRTVFYDAIAGCEGRKGHRKVLDVPSIVRAELAANGGTNASAIDPIPNRNRVRWIGGSRADDNGHSTARNDRADRRRRICRSVPKRQVVAVQVHATYM